MDRDEVEEALLELDALLDRDSHSESDYQQWFERHPVVFFSFGFQKVIPHPRLVSPDGEEWIPDFLVQPPSGVWEVFEITTPQATILVDRGRRSTFYATFEGYVSQCREYAEMLDDPRTREEFLEREGAKLPKNPRISIVAGRSIGLDRDKLQRLASSRVAPLAIVTFDDVRAQVEHYRTSTSVVTSWPRVTASRL